MKHFLSLVPAPSLLLVGLVCAGLVACGSTPPRDMNASKTALPNASPAQLTQAYNGLFISSCTELDAGLYYADAVELKPRDATHVDAQYIKVFFSGGKCEAESRMVQLRLPLATWEVLKPVSIDGKPADEIKVTLPAGLITAVINDPKLVKETSSVIDISYGSKESNLPIQKQTELAVDKELRMINGNALYFSDPGSAITADGFPTELQMDDAFLKQ